MAHGEFKDTFYLTLIRSARHQGSMRGLRRRKPFGSQVKCFILPIRSTKVMSLWRHRPSIYSK
jgi:hypothetical protein